MKLLPQTKRNISVLEVLIVINGREGTNPIPLPQPELCSDVLMFSFRFMKCGDEFHVSVTETSNFQKVAK